MSRVHLKTGKQSVVLTLEPAPALLYWGERLHQCTQDDMDALAPGVAWSAVNERIPLTLIPEFGRGNMDCSGIEGNREGLDWAPIFKTQSWQQTDNQLSIICEDTVAKLQLSIDLCLFEQMY